MLLQAILIVFCKCAYAGRFEGKIIGGAYADIRDFPHVVFLHVICEGAEQYVCGSSIVNQRLLLTAAHCLECEDGDIHPHSIVAIAGTDNFRKKGPDGVYLLRNAKKMIKHESWDSDKTINDIAMLLLNEDLKFGSNVKRVIVPKTYIEVPEARVAGWGLTNEVQGDTTEKLKFAKVIISTSGICSMKPLSQICIEEIGFKEGKPALGDSGSGLVTSDYKLLGLVSYRHPKFLSNSYFTNITYYYDWIMENSKKLYCLQ